jgi:membrane fusion protein, heavy metal efflux system
VFSNRFRMGSVLAASLAALGLFEAGCGRTTKEVNASTGSPPVEAGYFTVPQNQLPHLKIASAATMTWNTVVHTTGTVDWDQNHTTQAITQVSGPISRILVDTGYHVKAGDPLLYVSSPDVATAISAYKKARNRQEFTRQVLNRTRDLLNHGAAAQKDVESAQADYNDAFSDVQTSLQSLKIFGITKTDIDQAERQGQPISSELAVRAPITGTVVQRLVNPGQLVQAGATVCFALSDVSTVWVQGHVFDHDLESIHIGDEVVETNPSFARTFHGRIAYIDAAVDPSTRTTGVRIVTANPGGLLKKDMYVDADIHTRTQRNVLTVPVSAVLHDAQNQPFVYLQVQPGKFAQRQIQTGAQQGDRLEVLGGLNAGDPVVTEGSIFLQFANNYQ